MRREISMKSVFFCIGLLMFLIQSVSAQDSLKVRGYFGADSIRIGQVVPYTLTARYPQQKIVLFPDSTFSFKPFEISSKKFFQTRTKDGRSYDSAVYYLTTFEIDSIQRLTLPVFIVQEKDCVVSLTMPDTLILQFSVAAVPDSVSADKLPLKTNTLYQQVQWIFNYPIALIVLGVLIVLLVIAWIVFGKRIRKYFALKKLTREYEAFIQRFGGVLQRLSSEFSSRSAEEALIVWKNYLEDLEKFPYTKFTSREIVRLANDPALENALRSIDRSIYGGVSTSVDPFTFLKSYSQQRFQKKEAEVKNG